MSASWLCQLTMSARVIPITPCLSSVHLSVRPSVRLKPISYYTFGWIAFKIYTGVKYDITNPACASIGDQTIFNYLANF